MHPKDVPFKEFRLILQRHARPRHSLFRTFTRTRHVFRRVSSFSIVREKFTDRWVKLKKKTFSLLSNRFIKRFIVESNIRMERVQTEVAQIATLSDIIEEFDCTFICFENLQIFGIILASR